MSDDASTGLVIGQILLLAAEFHHREDALRLPTNTVIGEQKIKVEVELQASRTDERDPAVFFIRVETTGDPPPLYSFKIEMAAMVQASGPAVNLGPRRFLAQSGVHTLFPFIRETVANLTMRGRFGPVWLQPVNVAAITGPLVAGYNADHPEQPRPLREASRSKALTRPARKK